jgi:hypothetical protein
MSLSKVGSSRNAMLAKWNSAFDPGIATANVPRGVKTQLAASFHGDVLPDRPSLTGPPTAVATSLADT